MVSMAACYRGGPESWVQIPARERIINSEYCKYYLHCIVVFFDWLSGAWYCISRPAMGCSSYTHISFYAA